MHVITRALTYYKGETGRIALSLGMIVLLTLSSVLMVYPSAILVDSVFGDKKVTGTLSGWFFAYAPDSQVGQIIALALITLALGLTRELMSMFQTLLNIRIGYGGLMRVRCDLFRKLQHLSLAYHKSQPQGDAIYRLSWDTYGVQNVVQGFIQTVLLNLLTLTFMLVTMLNNNVKLTIVAMAVAPLLYWITRLYGKILQKKATEAKEVESHLTTTIQRSANSIGLVQAFGREYDEYAKFETNVNDSVSAYLRLHWQEVLFWLCIGSLLAIGSAAVLGYGGYLVYLDQTLNKVGGEGFTAGKLLIFLGLLLQLYTPLQKLSGAGSLLATGVAGCNRVFEVLDRDPIIKDAPNAISLPKQARELALNDVVFGYRKERQQVLDGISCTIRPGEMVAFVGESGVGKTTLLSLVPRFYDPWQGSLTLDGHDLRQIKVGDVRKHVALVLQENVVLPTSVRENIAYGRPGATDAEIKRAAELAGASGFIDKLEHGYAEQISESGGNLSGGQRQRISIARALLTEAPVIIMDEPTSALDPQHEQLITETLKGIKGLRTLILVSHRLSTVADCDRIFVMDAGKIVEQGTHEQLIAERGRYFAMAKHQMKLADEPDATEENEPQIQGDERG